MKKQYKILFIILFLWNLAHPQTVFYNYLKTSLVKTAGVKQISSIDSLNSIQTVKYFDGLGRHIQTVQARITPNGYDMIQPVYYDSIGRQAKTYLPYVATTTNAYIDESWATNQAGFYSSPESGIASSAYPFAEVEFDNSPLNRVMKQGAPGAAWQLNEHPVEFDYQTNNYNNSIIIWEYNSSTAHASKDGYYATGTLYIVETTDENGNVSKEYKNLQGQVVLKTNELASDTYYTYYVYDDFGNLGTVIPPKAYALMEGESWSLTDSVSNLVYIYKYDQRQRMVEKQIPGAEVVYMVYDKLDRLVLTQDGNMRDSSLWMFTKYDAFSRPVITGTYSNAAASQAAMQTIVNTSTTYYETFNSTTKEYSNNAFPTDTSNIQEYLSYTYYDNYNFIADADTTKLNFHPTNDTGLDSLEYISAPKGLATGAKIKVLGTANDYLLSATYYDKFLRPVQTIADHAQDGYDVTWTKYGFTGKADISKVEHTYNTDSTRSMKWWYTYDHAERLTQVKHQVGTQTPQVIIANEYNELGQLIEKNLHANNPDTLSQGYWQSVDYAYNIRGWMTEINKADLSGTDNDLFGMELRYEEGLADRYGTPMYNGNISGMIWKIQGGPERAYGLRYDEINRLNRALYAEKGTTNYDQHLGRYNVTGYNQGNIEYDENGNIMYLWRKGENSGTSSYTYGYIDNLSYSYDGNQLKAVQDAVPTIGDGKRDFTELVENTIEYTYDANGNMTKDDNKGIVGITYNYLNLPSEINFGNGDKIVYIYDASGTKLQKQIYDNSSLTNTKTYAGSFIYANDTLEYALFDEGRLIDESGTFRYEYFLKDHLGNTRVTFTKNGSTVEILQQDHYYPFGMNFAGISTTQATLENKYKYNGKEKQDEFGMNWYDYGARFYDPVIARWHVVDPMAETSRNMTPYHYASNNSINRIDPDGMLDVSMEDSEEKKQEYHEQRAKDKKLIDDKRTISPTDEPVISSEFGPREAPVEGASTNHKGVDIVKKDPSETAGTEIVAPKNGKIIAIKSKSDGNGAGNRVHIKANTGETHSFFHMSDTEFGAGLSVGSTVYRGQKIGQVGNTGTGSGAHLHYEIRDKLGGTARNPRSHNSGIKNAPTKAEARAIQVPEGTVTTPFMSYKKY